MGRLWHNGSSYSLVITLALGASYVGSNPALPIRNLNKGMELPYYKKVNAHDLGAQRLSLVKTEQTLGFTRLRFRA